MPPPGVYTVNELGVDPDLPSGGGGEEDCICVTFLSKLGMLAVIAGQCWTVLPAPCTTLSAGGGSNVQHVTC